MCSKDKNLIYIENEIQLLQIEHAIYSNQINDLINSRDRSINERIHYIKQLFDKLTDQDSKRNEQS